MVSRNCNSFNHRLTFKSYINPVPNWTKFSYNLPNCNLKRRRKTQNTHNPQIYQASLGFHIPLIGSNNITIKSHIYKNWNTNYRPVYLSISSMLVWQLQHKHIDDTNSVLIHKLPKHQSHNLHGNPSPPYIIHNNT